VNGRLILTSSTTGSAARFVPANSKHEKGLCQWIRHLVRRIAEQFSVAKVRGQIGKRKSYNDLMDIEDLSAAE
jgi:hypothetical protein